LEYCLRVSSANPKFNEESKQMKRVVMMLAVGLVGIAMGAISIPPAYAAAKSKVDCTAVMKERNSGKKAKEVAKEMSISVSSVYRCKQRETAAAKAASKAGNETSAKPATSTAAAAKP
jgi:hypothetical protein